MRLFLFGVSVFYLLGLKLTSQTEIKSSINAKPVINESKVIPEIKQQVQPLELKPELIKSDTVILPETKSVHPAVPSIKAQKRSNSPQS